MSVRRSDKMVNSKGEMAWIVDYRDEFGCRKQIRTDAVTRDEAEEVERVLKANVNATIPVKRLREYTIAELVDELRRRFAAKIGKKMVLARCISCKQLKRTARWQKAGCSSCGKAGCQGHTNHRKCEPCAMRYRLKLELREAGSFVRTLFKELRDGHEHGGTAGSSVEHH